MTAAEFIDLIVTPIGSGIAATIGFSIVAKKQPEKLGPLSHWGFRVLLGVCVALALFISKIV